MSDPKLITKFADDIEDLAKDYGITNSEFVYVIEWLKTKRYLDVASKEGLIK